MILTIRSLIEPTLRVGTAGSWVAGAATKDATTAKVAGKALNMPV